MGAKIHLNGTSKVNTQTDKQTDSQTDISTYRKHRPKAPMLLKSWGWNSVPGLKGYSLLISFPLYSYTSCFSSQVVFKPLIQDFLNIISICRNALDNLKTLTHASLNHGKFSSVSSNVQKLKYGQILAQLYEVVYWSSRCKEGNTTLSVWGKLF